MVITMFYRPKYFRLYELVPKAIYQEYEANKKLYLLWNVFDYRMLHTLDSLRTKYGRITMNDWKWKGDNQYRGWRDLSCEIGSELSQHKFGRAADLKPSQTTSEAIRKDILANPDDDAFKYITCIEEGVSWLHFDVRDRDKANNGILIVRP